MKYFLIVIGLFLVLQVQAGVSENNESEAVTKNRLPKQSKTETILTSKQWVCLDVSKKRLTKKLAFDIGNEINFKIDKKYSFKNNNYDYSNGKWRLDGKFLYLFYNAPGTESKVETVKYKIITLNDGSFVIKRTSRPKGKITFK